MARLSSPLVVLVSVMLLSAACGGGGGPTPSVPVTPVATRLAFTVTPADLRTLDAFSTAPTVEIRDAAGTRLSSSTANVTLTLAGGTTGATLRGTTTVAAVNGVATFPALSIDLTGTGYTLVASSTGLTSATSPAFAVRGRPVVLAFRTQPASGEAGLPFATQPVVELRDSVTGAVLTDRRDTVALAISTRPSTGVLFGAARVAAVNGVAIFSGVGIDLPGPGYVLTAATTGAPTVTSNAFTVLSITAQLTLVSGGGQFGAPSAPLPQPIRLRVSRPGNNTPIVGRTVTFAVAGGGSVSSSSAVSDQNGDVMTVWTLGASGFQTLTVRTNESNDGAVFVSANFTAATLQLTQIVAGLGFFCGVQPANRGAVCWGDNAFGQLGNGPSATPDASARAVRVIGNQLGVIYAGYDNACGSDQEGRLLCWGNNDNGQLGNGTFSNAPAPQPVADVSYTYVGIGRTHVCGIPSAPTTRCWGSNGSGELGNGPGGVVPRPAPMSGNPRFRRIASGADFSCGLAADDVISCWGRNSSRQLGDGSSVASRSVAAPIQMPTGVTFQTLSVGFASACAISRQSRLFCWGANNVGQLGDGTTTLRPVPTPIGPNFTVRRVAVGLSHTCAIVDPAGDLYCWGNNDTGALGDGTTVSRQAPGAPVSGGRRWLDVVVSVQTSCGIEGGSLRVFCWGSAFRGALGDGFATQGAPALLPQPVIEPLP